MFIFFKTIPGVRRQQEAGLQIRGNLFSCPRPKAIMPRQRPGKKWVDIEFYVTKINKKREGIISFVGTGASLRERL